MPVTDEAEAKVILATARMYGEEVNALLARGRHAEARQQSVRVKMLLSALPTTDDEAEASRLLRAAQGALDALGPAPPPDRRQTRPASNPRGPLAIGIALLIVASLLAWPRIDDMLRVRAYNAAALDALHSLDDITQSLERGMSYREYVSAVMDKVRPPMMFLRGRSYATQTRLRRSYDSINHAFLIVDGQVDTWRKAKAADPAFPDAIRLSEVSTNLQVQQMTAQWREAVGDLREAHAALAGSDVEGQSPRSHPGAEQAPPAVEHPSTQRVVEGPSTAPERPPTDSEFASVGPVLVASAAMVHLGTGDATLTGRVVDAASGAPLRGARVGLTIDSESVVTAQVRTAGDGTFGFDRMAARTNYWIWVEATGYQRPLTRSSILFNPGESSSMEIRLKRGP